MLTLNNVSVCVGSRSIVRDVSFSIMANDFFVIMGPNGAGKTTIIRAIMQDMDYTGEIKLNNRPIGAYSAREIARTIGVLSQSGNNISFPYSAYDVIKMGRYSYQRGIFDSFSSADRSAIDEAVALTGAEGLLGQNVQTLSGGELQRVMLAKLLAQNPSLLILDEPTNHLDFQHQINTFDILKDWAKRSNHAVIAIVHDFNITRAYATSVLMMETGEVRAVGTPGQVLSRTNLKAVYNYDVTEWMTDRLSEWKAVQ